jgi:hypothetical protein
MTIRTDKTDRTSRIKTDKTDRTFVRDHLNGPKVLIVLIVLIVPFVPFVPTFPSPRAQKKYGATRMAPYLLYIGIVTR